MKTMRLIALVAMTHMLGACALQGGVSSPASPEPARTDGTAAPSAADAALVHQAAFDGWSMPEPGPFDPNAVTTEDIFKACEDIPDEVFEELGISKKGEGDSFEPYLCDIQPENSEELDGVFMVVTWASSLRTLLDRGFWQQASNSRPDSNLVQLESIDSARGIECSTAIETPQGTVVVSNMNFMKEPDCEATTEILLTLFGGENGNQY